MHRAPTNHIKTLTFLSMLLNCILLGVITFIIVLILKGNQTKPDILPVIHTTTTLNLIAVKTNIINTEIPIVVEPVKPKAIVSRSVKPDPHEKINNYVRTISSKYKIDPALIMSIIQQESTYSPTAKVGDCLGLMQVSKRWHSNRAAKLGVTNFYDSYDNILIGVDYLAELFTSYKDPKLVLMLYSMDHKTAFELYDEGRTSSYAKTVLARAEVYRKGG